MFTGIITDIGKLRIIEASPEKHHLVIGTHYETATIAVGASIACDGCCLTVVEKGRDWFAVDVSRETLDCTKLADWKQGTKINLERPLRMGDELGGHMLSGHVDGVATITAIKENDNAWVIELEAPANLAPYIAKKGSVALDGISLTVNTVVKQRFSVNIIPHTLQVTTLGSKKTGKRLNLEIDMLARYIARLHEK